MRMMTKVRTAPNQGLEENIPSPTIVSAVNEDEVRRAEEIALAPQPTFCLYYFLFLPLFVFTLNHANFRRRSPSQRQCLQ